MPGLSREIVHLLLSLRTGRCWMRKILFLLLVLLNRATCCRIIAPFYWRCCVVQYISMSVRIEQHSFKFIAAAIWLWQGPLIDECTMRKLRTVSILSYSIFTQTDLLYPCQTRWLGIVLKTVKIFRWREAAQSRGKTPAGCLGSHKSADHFVALYKAYLTPTAGICERIRQRTLHICHLWAHQITNSCPVVICERTIQQSLAAGSFLSVTESKCRGHLWASVT
jgi:hypothetical protein